MFYLDLTSDFAVLSLTSKILCGLYLRNCKLVVNLYLVGTLVGGV